jgi:hypothetical protein
MTSPVRLIINSAIGLLGLYWAFVVIARSAFGIELPDPADILPYAWRGHVPRTL